MKKGACGCTNHLGKPKVKYPSQQAALDAIMKRHIRFGPHSAYRCPRMDGVWHVKSVLR